MKNIKLYISILVVVLLSSCNSGARKPVTTSTSGTITLMCDNSFENIMQQEIDVFEFQYPKAHILARYLPQRDVIDSLMQLKTRAIVTARDLTEAEKKELKKNKRIVRSKMIAVDALALIVNPENTIEMISRKEIGDILTGKLTEWNDVEPSKMGDIRIVFDHENSSTVQYMRDSLMNGEPFGPNIHAQGSIKGVFEAVKKNKNAIGVIGVSWITSDMRSGEASTQDLVNQLNDEGGVSMAEFDNSVKVLKVMGNTREAYKPYQQYIYDGRYPLFRQIYMIIASAGGSLEHGFFSFVTSFNGQKLIMKTGVMPAVMHPQIVQLGE
ncbi:MAG: substrate-binding domain-containing protein [Muribaculaceae bacterium]|nr:substrate-binding domain-containing protein [Muribaculaceae bacterium]